MGKPSNKQLSKKALQDVARPFAYNAIMKAADLLENGDNDNVKLGAAKLILAKVLPDLKAVEVEGDLALQINNVLRLPNKRPLDTPSKTD